jgi:lipoyl(octanoyl) transferase
MRDYTDQRDAESPDQLWLLQHAPVFTQGLAGKPEHVRDVGDIPLVESDRGGQVTYHGPGQLIGYVLLDLKRLQLGIRELVTRLEETLIAQLADYGIAAAARPDAPGVYVSGRKIASLGLRVRRGCSYHGISLNSDMDLLPFQQINPCGYPGLEMTQLSQLGGPTEIQQVSGDFLRHFCQRFPFNPQLQQGTPTTLNAGVKT